MRENYLFDLLVILPILSCTPTHQGLICVFGQSDKLDPCLSFYAMSLMMASGIFLIPLTRRSFYVFSECVNLQLQLTCSSCLPILATCPYANFTPCRQSLRLLGYYAMQFIKYENELKIVSLTYFQDTMFHHESTFQHMDGCKSTFFLRHFLGWSPTFSLYKLSEVHHSVHLAFFFKQSFL